MPTILTKDKLINADTVGNNFIYVNDKVKYKKKITVFPLEEVTEFQQRSKVKRKEPLPEPGIYLNISDDQYPLYFNLKDKYNFFKNNFNKKLKYTLFKPLNTKSEYQKIDITNDSSYYQLITNFEQLLQRTLQCTIQPKLMKKGSSGTYMIFNSIDTNPSFIFKPMNEEPYSIMHQPKWLKFLQYKLLPWTFGRECLINNGNYGYITDLQVSRLDYMLFGEDTIVPWCDVCVLDSASFFAKNSVRTNIRVFFKDIVTDIEQNYEQSINWVYYCFVFIKKFFLKIFKLIVFIFTGTFSGERIAVQRKLGSLQVFERDFVTADVFFKNNPLPEQDLEDNETFNIWTPEVLNELHIKLQKLFVLDFLIRNTDRNLDNWMINYSPDNESGNRIKIKAIDNSLAMPFHHPNSIRTYPFEWLNHLPLYILKKKLDPEFIQALITKLSNDSWWESFRLIFWECHSRSGKVFVANSTDANFANYYDNPNLNLFDNNKVKLNIDYKVDLQWSLLKGQAFLLYKLLKAGISGIEVDIIDLIQMERCYVYEDSCYYYTSNHKESDSTLKKEIWQSLGLDINEMFGKFERKDIIAPEYDFNHNWDLFLKGKISDEQWLNFLRTSKYQKKGDGLDVLNLQANIDNLEDIEDVSDLDASESSELINDTPNKFVIASSINYDTSLISEYFYDAVSSINNQTDDNASENDPMINASTHYESFPIDVPIYKGNDKEILAESLHSVLSKPYESNKTSIISGYGACINPNEESSKPPEYEIFYIDRLEVCKEPKPLFKTW